jgi:hypothetical protein
VKKSIHISIFSSFFSEIPTETIHLNRFSNQKRIHKKDSLSAAEFLDSLAENNYYFTKILNVEKVEKTTKILFDKGKNFNEAKVKFS